MEIQRRDGDRRGIDRRQEERRMHAHSVDTDRRTPN